MKRIGDTLTEHALSNPDPMLATLFAKSAYNRYYYFCWLSIRAEIKSLISTATIKHGPDVGNIMRSSYQKKILQGLEAANLPDLADKKRRLGIFIQDISSLMGSLNSIRQAADYQENATIKFTAGEPEIEFLDNGKTITRSIKSVVADLEMISSHLNEIKNIKKEVGLE